MEKKKKWSKASFDTSSYKNIAMVAVRDPKTGALRLTPRGEAIAAKIKKH